MATYEKELLDFLKQDKQSGLPSDTPITTVAPAKAEDSSFGLGVVGGLGALGALAAGAYSLGKRRLPGANVLKEIAEKTKPALPETRVTELGPVDKVAEILEVVPTKMQRAAEVRPAEYQQFIDQFKQLKDTSVQKPLTMGGTKERFGSALYDYLAQHPANKPLPAETWIKEFTNFNRLASLSIPKEGARIKASITKEELFDTNIAKFDKNGNIVGGFLDIARLNNLPVSKLDLMQLVEKSPGANVTIKRFKVQNPDELVSKVNDITVNTEAAAKEAITKLDEWAKTNLTNKNISTYESAKNYLEKLRKQNLQNNVYINNNFIQGYDVKSIPVNYLENTYKELNNLSKTVKDSLNLDLMGSSSFSEALTNSDRNIKSLKRAYDLQKTQDLLPRYGGSNATSYRIRGAEDYIEDVAYIKEMPMGRDVIPGRAGGQSHFTEVGNEKLNNQIYHVRYGKRSLEGNPNKKVYAIDEIQSDVQAVMSDKDPERLKVFNPYGADQQFNQANTALNILKNKMKDLASKGGAMTNEDKVQYWKLSQNFDELRKKTINASSISETSSQFNKADFEKYPFLPFFDRSSYGDHALKQVLKTAAENNVEWVVVNPVERLHALRNISSRDGKPILGKLGDWEFYGTNTGKAGKQNVHVHSDQRPNEAILTNTRQNAVIPERMIDLAKQYNSEAKTINVSLSDPEKPFKIVKPLNLKVTDAKELGIPANLRQEHIAAFRTQEEAEAFLSQAGESAKVIKMEANDPALYYPAFGIKVTDTMKGTPFKLYKKEGGLVVNIFA